MKSTDSRFNLAGYAGENLGGKALRLNPSFPGWSEKLAQARRKAAASHSKDKE
jgi:hypothetical protein